MYMIPHHGFSPSSFGLFTRPPPGITRFVMPSFGTGGDLLTVGLLAAGVAAVIGIGVAIGMAVSK